MIYQEQQTISKFIIVQVKLDNLNCEQEKTFYENQTLLFYFIKYFTY